jgi:hypothetical protein
MSSVALLPCAAAVTSRCAAVEGRSRHTVVAPRRHGFHTGVVALAAASRACEQTLIQIVVET